VTENLSGRELLSLTETALEAAEQFVARARAVLLAEIAPRGALDVKLLDEKQFAAHAFAWASTYVEALRQFGQWGQRLSASVALGELETLILRAAFGEYLSQLAGGIAMSQGEVARPADIGLSETDIAEFRSVPAVHELVANGNTDAARARIAELLGERSGAGFGALGFEDETLDAIREQFHRFGDEEVAPHAHEWHTKNELIPLSLIEQMAELGVFGLTIPEEFGGLGMSKIAMCIVTEELSRAYIGAGSLGTRSEIAAELIRLGGTPAQKQHYLPRIASGEILPTAVFTEPNAGSDLGSLRTRAVREGDVYRINGNKTWITHAARSDLMTLLARTNMNERGYKSLSMFLAEKPRGTEDDPFPAPGMRGGEIEVIGYRGMREYEIAFENFEVPAQNLLGDMEGQGFKQLMETFESARIQTAARAVGVAQNALELAMKYAQERVQFGQPIYGFPRVYGKIAWMAVETMIARQLTYFAARERDSGRRCDIQAGMAKLLAARVAWACADNAVQIHGGNGFAIEYAVSRVLCDARILNIFEGAAEIQAQVIARGLLSERN
jgi:(2S)-methylsuccinyl-CoA dehydrogenase